MRLRGAFSSLLRLAASRSGTCLVSNDPARELYFLRLFVGTLMASLLLLTLVLPKSDFLGLPLCVYLIDVCLCVWALRSASRLGAQKPARPRQIDLSELLGRPAVKLDDNGLASALNGKTILVTGGAGSIGSELCRQIARLGPGSLLLLDKDESGIFYLQHELKRRFPGLVLETIIADIRNAQRLENVFRKRRIDYVFHAAAYKHVPLMEENIYEAIGTNVGGTINLVHVAQQHGCDKFVLISSDKAVHPTSVMGATKRAAELALESLPQGSTSFLAVRFGNVLGSVGSVVPLFLRQIAAGGPVTVTHPDATRYFMTVEEAVHLVLHAALIGHCRGVYMLDMGQPVRILDLAEKLVRLSGFEPYVDVPVEFSGLRPGEKLHEDLILGSEEFSQTGLNKVLRVRTHVQTVEKLADRFTEMNLLLAEGEDSMLLDWLCRTVREFHPGAHHDDLKQPIPLHSVRTASPWARDAGADDDDDAVAVAG